MLNYHTWSTKVFQPLKILCFAKKKSRVLSYYEPPLQIRIKDEEMCVFTTQTKNMD
jgi:hypothetical protein